MRRGWLLVGVLSLGLSACSTVRQELGRHHVVTVEPAVAQQIRTLVALPADVCPVGQVATFAGVRDQAGFLTFDVRCEQGKD